MFKNKVHVIALRSLLFLAVFELFLSIESFPGHRNLKNYLLTSLTKVDSVSQNYFTPAYGRVLYVFGGDQNSLRLRFKASAILYHQNIAKTIFIHHRSGISNYHLGYKRNLTNNEWAVLELIKLGINKNDIEILKAENGFFGTFNEVMVISEIIKKRDFKSIILVSSAYHTKRVWESSSRVLNNMNVDLFIYAANEKISLTQAATEYFKLFLYKNFLFP